MLEIINLSYDLLKNNRNDELFSLRKEIFKNRLNWAVNCVNNREFDEYDYEKTDYLLGIYDKNIICSVRFIETKYPNMITGTFYKYFDKPEIPKGNYIESSRFFVDKARAKNTI